MSQRSTRELRPGGRQAIVLLLALSGALLAAGSASGWEIYAGDRLRAQLDTTLSMGASLRVEDRDDSLIFKGNDPRDRSAGVTDAFFSNSDDGNLNYDQGDFYSVNVKATFDLEVDYNVDRDVLKNLGAFVRASAFYDFMGACPHCTRRTDLSSEARFRSSVIDGGVVGAQWIFLDMYADAAFDVVGHPLDLRIGNQVLSWGESLFIPGGIASTNAFDVTKLRIPGSQLKEAFVPAPILRASGEVWQGLGLEAYYQFGWNRTNVDPVGSYFAVSDLAGRGAEAQVLGGNDPGSGCEDTDDPEGCLTGQAFSPPSPDSLPSDQGQFGVALRYFWSRFQSDFGLYYLRYHAKRPTVGVTGGLGSPPSPFESFFLDYAEGIDLVGFSFNTEVLNSAFAAEVSYRPNAPTAIVANGLSLGTFFVQFPPPIEPYRIRGFVREKRVQAQASLISTLGPATRLGVGQLVEWLKMDSVAFTMEMGVLNYPDLSEQCATVNDARDSILFGTFDCTPYAGVGAADNGVSGDKSTVDATSAGYSILMLAPYSNPRGVPITLTPSLGFSQDFAGIAPDQTFIDGRKSVTLGLEVDYLGVWNGKITYANFFGAGNKNLGKDRDFVAFSMSYSF